MAAAMTMAARMVLDMEITFIIWPTALPQEVQQPLVVQLELPRYGLMGALGEVYARPEHARMAALRGYDGLAPQVREEPLTEQTAVEEVYGAVHLTAPRTVEDKPRGTGADVQGTRHAVAVALVEHASPHALAARHEAQARVLIVHYHRARAPLAVGGELRHALAEDVCEAVEQSDVVLEHEGTIETALHAMRCFMAHDVAGVRRAMSPAKYSARRPGVRSDMSPSSTYSKSMCLSAIMLSTCRSRSSYPSRTWSTNAGHPTALRLSVASVVISHVCISFWINKHRMMAYCLGYAKTMYQ